MKESVFGKEETENLNIRQKNSLPAQPESIEQAGFVYFYF